MSTLPDPVKRFVEIFSYLPSIGPRQATRLAFHLLSLGKNNIVELAKVIADLGQLKTCPQCFDFHNCSGNFCAICGNPQRPPDTIMVIEKSTDLMSLEKTGQFNGRYFIIGALKKDGVLSAEQKLRLNSLKSQIKKGFGQAREIILAINPTTYGDANAAALSEELKTSALKISRLGRGMPTGGEIEFADEGTLKGALDNRY